MGNIIISDDIISVTDAMLSVRTEATGYNDENMLVLNRLSRCFRADDVTKSDTAATSWLFKVSFSGATSIAAVVLCDVNFDRVRFQSSPDDAAWTDRTAELTVSLNSKVNRYNIYVPLTSFNYQYIRAYIPNAATAVGRYTTKWQIGSMCLLSAASALSLNAAYGLSEEAPYQYENSETASGGIRRVKLGDLKRWTADVPFTYPRSATNEAELWAVDTMDSASPLVFYKNDSDTSEVYICHKDGNYRGEIIGPDLSRGNILRFVECV